MIVTSPASRTLPRASSVVGMAKWGKYFVPFLAYLDCVQVMVHDDDVIVVMSDCLVVAYLPVVDVVVAVAVVVVLVAAVPGAVVVVVVQYAVVVVMVAANVLDNLRHVTWVVECGVVVDDAAVVDLSLDGRVVVALVVVVARDTSLTGPIGHPVPLRITTRNRRPSNFDLAAFGACVGYLAAAFDHHVGAYYDRERIPRCVGPGPAARQAIRHVYNDTG